MHINALYVDDEASLHDVVKLFLEQSGEINVDCAPSVDAAERSLQTQGYDVIISDYQMPGISGIEFLKRLRSRNYEIPFILYTGRGREEVVIDALNSGADFYMQKGGAPRVQFAELENYIRQGVQRYRSERAKREGEERFRSLVNNSFEGIAVHIGHVMVEANSAFCRITGYTREELLGRSISELYSQRSWEVMLEKFKHPVAEPYDVQIVRKDGTEIEVKTRGKDIEWGGQVARFSTVLDFYDRDDKQGG
ncbi:MAG: response regulator [Methanomassiliicoccus sp.]|nr:response regulator [Methanomassiliicoccus sp.]